MGVRVLALFGRLCFTPFRLKIHLSLLATADPRLLPSSPLPHKRNILQRQNKPFVEFYSRQLGLSWDRPNAIWLLRCYPMGKGKVPRPTSTIGETLQGSYQTVIFPQKVSALLPPMGRRQLMITCTYTENEKRDFSLSRWSGHYFGKTTVIKGPNGKRVGSDGTICYKIYRIWKLVLLIRLSSSLWHFSALQSLKNVHLFYLRV